MTKSQLETIAGMRTASQQAAYYENLHISPLMVCTVFSQSFTIVFHIIVIPSI